MIGNNEGYIGYLPDFPDLVDFQDFIADEEIHKVKEPLFRRDCSY